MATFASLVRRAAATQTPKERPVAAPHDERRPETVVAPFAGPRPASGPGAGVAFPTWLGLQRASAASDERQADELGAELGRDLREITSVSPGALSRDVRRMAERRLGVDLAGTTLHADRDADARAERQGALATTNGTRVDFGAGLLSTSTDSGRSLLGHELVHVAQQRAHAGAGRAFGFAAPALAAPSRAVQAKPKPMDAGPPQIPARRGAMGVRHGSGLSQGHHSPHGERARSAEAAGRVHAADCGGNKGRAGAHRVGGSIDEG